MNDIADHPLLSAGAASLEPAALTAHADLAILLLGFADQTFTGTDLSTAQTAVTLQVNRQVQKQLDPDVFIAASVSRGQRSITYRDDVDEILDRTAMQLATGLLGGAGALYPPVFRSRR